MIKVIEADEANAKEIEAKRVAKIEQMTAGQLADFLRSEAWAETDRCRRLVFERAADAIEHKLPQGPKKADLDLQRNGDIILVERYYEIKRELVQGGSKRPATAAFEQLAVEYNFADGETARRIYQRALKRSRLGRPGHQIFLPVSEWMVSRPIAQNCDGTKSATHGGRKGLPFPLFN